MTSQELIDKLAIIDENILAEAAKQPILFVEAARYRVEKMRERARATAEFETWEAELGLAIRAKYKTSDNKLTETAIKAKIRKHSGTKKRDKELQDSYAEEELAKLILDAYRMRKSAIQVISDMQVLEGNREAADVEKLEARRKLSTTARNLEERRKRGRDVE